MNIVMVSSEALPFSKTGGLSDVVFSLSKEFVKLGNNVSIVLPYYENVDYTKLPKTKPIYELLVKMNWREYKVGVVHAYFEGIDFYLIKNEYYFKRDGFYGFFDDGERFAFFQNATIELLRKFVFKVDVVHVHDWQAGMIPCLLKEKYRKDEQLNDIKTVLTIHNPLFKGFFNKDSLFDFYGLDERLYTNGSVRFEEKVSTLKAGIHYADKITTVSPTHAYELTTPEGSKGLWYEMTLRNDDFQGILNGIDSDFFNPKTDKLIVKNYDIDTYKTGKRACKVAFCNKYHLNPDLPLFAVISRLSDQKGLDLIFAMADFSSYTGGNFAVVGSGEKYAEDYFNGLYSRNPHHIMVYIGYEEKLAHELYSACDFLIMPSQFEPCGISQMIAQAYGALPIVRATGGLKDSVLPYHEIENGNEVTFADGFSFTNYNVSEAIKAVGEATNLYVKEPDLIDTLIQNAMKLDNSWLVSAKKYLELYNSIIK